MEKTGILKGIKALFSQGIFEPEKIAIRTGASLKQIREAAEALPEPKRKVAIAKLSQITGNEILEIQRSRKAVEKFAREYSVLSEKKVAEMYAAALRIMQNQNYRKGSSGLVRLSLGGLQNKNPLELRALALESILSPGRIHEIQKHHEEWWVDESEKRERIRQGAINIREAEKNAKTFFSVKRGKPRKY